MSSFLGRSLHVDLSASKYTTREIAPDTARQYLGGVGLATRMLIDALPAHVDPLGPDNVMVFANSVFSGTPVPAGTKYAVATKSPLTGILGDSISSSFWALALRNAGYLALVITGQAPRPTCLFIDDDRVEFRDASGLMGAGCYETEERVRDELQDSAIRVATIGPAGENRVRFACIANDRGRQLGRTGPGAVMGSKNLKAIAVRGSGAVSVADLEGLLRTSLALIRKEQGPATEKYRGTGTVGNVLTLDRLGVLPARNFRQSTFETAEQVSGEYMEAHHTEKTVACAGCPIACEKIARVSSGPYAGTRVSIDYESLFALGPCCGIDDFPAILKAAELCDHFGLDTMSTGATVAWAMECAELGLLTPAETDGIRLAFGDPEGLLALIPRIARREGLGDLLAEGTRRAAAKLGRGSERFAMHCKGLELPGYEPRGLKTYALGLAVGTRGACHNRSAAYEPDIKGKVDRFVVEPGRGRLAKEHEDFAAVLDSLIICKFSRGCFGDFYAETAKLYELTTGLALTADDLRQAGERICNLKRVFAVREGMRREHDTLPPRILEEPLADGVGKGTRLTPEELERLLDDYYQARGWSASGIPTGETLSRLGLGHLLATDGGR
jgi:aldehyde:ferredoxin oxidoreductase